MRTITTQEIVDFIMAQPDDRPVDMRRNQSSDPCGCIGVHYGKEVLELDHFNVGAAVIAYQNEVIRAEFEFGSLSPQRYRFVGTYKEIKQHIADKENIKTLADPYGLH